MKYVLVLWYAAGLTTGQMVTSIGPYDNRASCLAARELVVKDRWEATCYPIGNLDSDTNQ